MIKNANIDTYISVQHGQHLHGKVFSFDLWTRRTNNEYIMSEDNNDHNDGDSFTPVVAQTNYGDLIM